MTETTLRRGARRLTALGASTALAASALAMGLAAPAMAAPVPVTTTVTDAAGNAIDAYVRAYRDNGSGTYYYEDGQRVASGVMNLSLEPGTYKFQFLAAGHSTEFYSDKPTLETADPVAVGGPVALGAVSLAPAAGIIGKVTDDQGRPLPYVEVNLYPVGGDNVRDYQTTGKDGSFAFPASAGSYKVEVSGTSVGRRSFAQEYYNNKETYETSETIAHGAGVTDLGVISLTRGAMIRGRVSGVGDGALARVQVSASRTDCTSCSTITDYTDAAGLYALEGLRSGSYKVYFSDPAAEYVSEYHADAADSGTATPIAVVKDQIVDVNANLAPRAPVDPATIDLAGRVLDSSGAPVVGADVSAWSTPTDPKNSGVESRTSTNRQGYYAFTELDPASSGTSENTFKVEATDGITPELNEFSRLGRFHGGVVQYGNAPSVTVAAGATTSGVDITLPLTGGISGTVTSETGEPVFHSRAELHSEEGMDSSSVPVDYDGTFESRRLVEGKYKVLFTDYGFALTSTDYLAHVPEWFSDAVVPEDAKTIVVKSGQVTSGIKAELATSLKAVEKPVIGGKQYVGKTVKARPGRWSYNTGTSFTYEWLIGSTVVGTGESIAISKGWQGKRLTLRVTAENGRYQGVALVNSQKLGVQPKIKIKTGSAATISIKAKKIKGNVVVREIVRVKANGKIKYKKIGKAKIKNGKARVSLAKVKGKGKHKVVFSFNLKGKLGNAEITKKIKRKR